MAGLETRTAAIGIGIPHGKLQDENVCLRESEMGARVNSACVGCDGSVIRCEFTSRTSGPRTCQKSCYASPSLQTLWFKKWRPSVRVSFSPFDSPIPGVRFDSSSNHPNPSPVPTRTLASRTPLGNSPSESKAKTKTQSQTIPSRQADRPHPQDQIRRRSQFPAAAYRASRPRPDTQEKVSRLAG